MSLDAGTRLGRYEIRSLLGAGGMGEVYLARDAQLDRDVALKILPAEIASDQQRLQRFLQEARAASKISGAHAAHIYEIGEVDGAHFIAMEHVGGEQLARHVAGRRLTAVEVAHFGAQIAEALEEAHARGVTHRDIKPQNVVVTPRGKLKVLDFGLAKLSDADGAPGEAATRVRTETGAVMGTVSYMSPEQALARADIDHRTDIFSLGVVLYEMATGRLPFEGASVTETIDRIVHAQPEAVARFNYDAPPELEVIIKKALRKNPDERYQTARDLLNDLRSLARELELAEARAFSSAPQSRASSPGEQATALFAPSASGQTRPAPSRPSSTAEDAPARPTASSAEYVVAGIRRHKRAAFVALAALVLIAAGTGFALYKFAGWGGSATPPVFQNITVSRITTSGTANEANISPDGKYVVYLEMAADGNRSLVVKQTATGNVLPIVPPTKGNILKHLTFSPDGNFVYYVFSDRVAPESLYRVPSIGGSPPKKLITDCQSPAALSPDGKRLAFVRRAGNVKSSLVVASEDGTNERTVATLEGRDWFEDYGPSWSPDGGTIAIVTGSAGGDGDEYRLVGVDAESGAIKELSPKRWLGAGRVVWMPDGAALLLVASESAEGDRPQVWRVSYPSGEASRVTNDVQGRDLTSLGVTADGRTLVIVTEQRLSRVETVPAAGDISRAARLTSAEANQEGFHGIAWTPQGRVVFSSFEGGQYDIWIMNADGTGRQRLTSDAFNDSLPAVSPDGRHVVFISNRPQADNVARLWRMDIDGGNPVQLTAGNGYGPHVSPDGRWVVYVSWSPADGITTLWRIAIEGGEPERLTDYPASWPAYSPDGQWIVCIARADPARPDEWRYSVIPAAGGRPVRQFDLTGFQYQYVRWTPDSRHLSYIGAPPDPSNVWLQPAAGGEPRKLTDFKSDYIFRHAWSADGRTLALVRGRGTSDVVLLRDER